MAERSEDDAAAQETLIEKLVEKFHDSDSTSSDSDDDNTNSGSTADSVTANIYRLFGRQKPVHTVLGGGKPADVMLWRNKKVSATVLGGATAIWVLFELMEYHLLTLICHTLILLLAGLFLWSNASNFINKSRPRIPEVSISEELAVNVALALRYDINRTIAALRSIASGHDLKKFLIVIAGLWFLSSLGNSCDFLTLFYIVFVTLHSVPFLYEKYEDRVDAFAEKAEAEFKKHFAVLHAKYLSKIPRGPMKAKKFQ